MLNESDALSKLSVALDTLETCHKDSENFLDASKKLLDLINSLKDSNSEIFTGMRDVHTRLTKEFVFAAKCAELRSPGHSLRGPVQGLSKY
jgi:hypothetical protein